VTQRIIAHGRHSKSRSTAMRMPFLGVGSAFTDRRYWQSAAMLTADSGDSMMIDGGGDLRHSLSEFDPDINNGNLTQFVRTFYVTHIHDDHIGHLQWIAFCTFFNPNAAKPTLVASRRLRDGLVETMREGWRHNHKIKGRDATIDDYFSCVWVEDEMSFRWADGVFWSVRRRHVAVPDWEDKESFGLAFVAGGSKVFFTGDSVLDPVDVDDRYKWADLILQEVETVKNPSEVHSHYNDLAALPEEIKGKMWLYHYQPNPVQTPEEDGFAGFVKKGQVFKL